MTGIVERIRAWPIVGWFPSSLARDAADRIEELTEAMQKINDTIAGWERIMCLPDVKDVKTVWNIARTALEERK